MYVCGLVCVAVRVQHAVSMRLQFDRRTGRTDPVLGDCSSKILYPSLLPPRQSYRALCPIPDPLKMRLVRSAAPRSRATPGPGVRFTRDRFIHKTITLFKFKHIDPFFAFPLFRCKMHSSSCTIVMESFFTAHSCERARATCLPVLACFQKPFSAKQYNVKQSRKANRQMCQKPASCKGLVLQLQAQRG